MATTTRESTTGRAAPIPELRSAEKPPFWRDVRNIRWGGQILVVLLTLWFLYWLYGNATTNFARSGLAANFDFLQFDFRSAIPGVEDAADLSILGAFWVGYLNVLRVIAVGIPVCTLLGTLIGVMRLSDNAMVRAVGTTYVEVFRNVPPLLWVLFGTTFYLIENAPQIESAFAPGGLFVISNRASAFPWFPDSASIPTFLAVVAVGIAATVAVVKWRGKVNERTGEAARGGLFGSATMLAFLVVAHFAAGNALALEFPELVTQDNGVIRVVGGKIAQTPWIGLTVALTLYTASHVAEIVRGAILAIHKGQTEAAQAIALTTFQRYRYIILPQALRIMIPPLASQYLNITKNTSLGVAIGYIELASIFQRISNNATPALLALIVMMGFYLTFSLGISVIANVINRRLALETR